MPRAALKRFFRLKALQCKSFTGYFGSGDSLAMFAPISLIMRSDRPYKKNS
jgi:hypothetical protein